MRCGAGAERTAWNPEAGALPQACAPSSVPATALPMQSVALRKLPFAIDFQPLSKSASPTDN